MNENKSTVDVEAVQELLRKHSSMQGMIDVYPIDSLAEDLSVMVLGYKSREFLIRCGFDREDLPSDAS